MKRLAVLLSSLMVLTGIAGAAHAQEVPVDGIRTQITALAPAGVRITALNATGKRVSVRGTSQNNQQVSQLLRNIDGAGGVSSLNLVSIEAVAGGYGFSLTLDVDCSVAGNLCTAPKTRAATVHKCEVDGKPVFQDRPCTGAAAKP
jgi:Tfp pilus assembly protein PilN